MIGRCPPPPPLGTDGSGVTDAPAGSATISGPRSPTTAIPPRAVVPPTLAPVPHGPARRRAALGQPRNVTDHAAREAADLLSNRGDWTCDLAGQALDLVDDLRDQVQDLRDLAADEADNGAHRGLDAVEHA